MEIKIIKTDNGATVRFPYELKESFRSTFKRAKWNPQAKHWLVGPRSHKRLEQWAESVRDSGVLQKLAENDSVKLADKELATLKVELVRKTQTLASELENQRSLEEFLSDAKSVRAKLAKIEDQIAKAEALRLEKERLLKEERDAIYTIVNRVVSLSEIEDLRRGMTYDWRALKAVNRERFDKKQERLREIEAELEEAGIQCIALSNSVAANYNRRDRDYQDLKETLVFLVADQLPAKPH